MISTLRLARIKLWQVHVFGAAIVVIAAIGILFFEIAPSLARHDAAVARQGDLEDRRSRKQELQTSLQRMQQRTADSEKLIKQAGVSFISSSQINDRIALLGELAGTAGLQVEGFEPAKPEPSTWLTTTNIRFTAKATYPDAIRFLSTLHEKLPDTVVISFELATSPSLKEPAATFIVQLMWHALPEKMIRKTEI